jgi:GNAT superfamily N-acetyltransferase
VGADQAVGVHVAVSPTELDEVRTLFRALVTWHRDRHVEDLDMIGRYFDTGEFERELAELPGEYAPQSGRLLLAKIGGVAVGCAALRRIDDQSCEMKRMFVSPAARHRGVGRALAAELIRRARDQRYASMYLDTSIRQAEALSLYRSLGFVDVEPYYDPTPPLRDWLVYLRLTLQAEDGHNRR